MSYLAWMTNRDFHTGKQRPETIDADTISINRGKGFPFAAFSRDGAVSDINVAFSNFVLGANVYGAQIGKLYKIARYYIDQSGVVDRWIVHEFDAAVYDSASAATSILNFSDVQPAVDPTLSRQTIKLKPPLRDGLEIELILDPSSLASSGLLDAQDSGDAGYSWVIDPACYRYVSTGAVTTALSRRMDAVERMQSRKKIGFSRTGDIVDLAAVLTSTLYQVATFGPYGPNLFPDFGNFYSCTADSPTRALLAARSTVSTRSTDFLSPWYVTDVANGGGEAAQATGGNHSKDNDGVTPTGVNVSFTVYADEVEVADGDHGEADCIRFAFVNRIYGSDVIDAETVNLEEHVSVVVRAQGFGILAAVENKTILVRQSDIMAYQGPQLFLDGYNNSVHFFGGSNNGRITGVATKDSGPSSGVLHIPVNALKKTATFQAAAWIDETYGLGTRSNMLRTDLAASYTNSSGKAYHRLISAFGTSSPVRFAAGTVLRWRGGYYFGPGLVTASTASAVDLALPIQQGLKQGYFAAANAAGIHKVTTQGAIGAAGTDTDGANQIGDAGAWIIPASTYKVSKLLLD